VVDRKDPARLYASLINNREFGGVYFSSNDGGSWAQLNEGLGSRDIFSLAQSANGEVLAGTNQGVFALDRKSQSWKPINVTLREKVVTIPVRHPKKGKAKSTVRREWVKGQITGRVAQVKISADRWLAATSQGLYRSLDQGKSWTGGPVLGQMSFVAVDSSDDLVLAASPTEVLFSRDGADTWSQLKLPNFVSRISNVSLGPKDELWILTHMGAFRSKDSGQIWEHAMAGTPLANFSFVGYDRDGGRLIGAAGSHGQIYESKDGGDTWTLAADAHYPIRNIAISRGRMLAVTEFNGVLAETPRDTQAAGGGN
jgi:ligand-binding sensor domain-containing protein